MATPAINRYAPVAPGSTSDVSGLQAEFASISARIGDLANFIATLTADIAAIQDLIAQLQAEMAALEVPDPAKYKKTETRMQGTPPVPTKVTVFDSAAFNAAMSQYQSKLQNLQSRIDDAKSKLAAKENELATKQSELAKAKTELEAAQKKLEQALANDQKKLEEQRKAYEEAIKKADEAQKRALEAQAQAQKAQDDLQRASEAVDRMLKAQSDLGTKTDDAALKAFKDESDKARAEASTALSSAKNHLPREVDDKILPPLSALTTSDMVELAPKLSTVADGLTATETGLMLDLVGAAPGEASRESLDSMETYWRAAGFSEDDIARAMMEVGGGDQAEVDAAAKRIRELLDESGAFNGVSHDELNEINDIIGDLNRVETRALFDQFSNEELNHWGDEMKSGAWFGNGGLNDDEKRDFFNTIADRLDSSQLQRFSEEVLRDRQETLRLAESIGQKSSEYTQQAFIDAMTTPTNGFVNAEDYALLAAMDPRLDLPQISGNYEEDAAAIADSLRGLADDPDLQEQFLNQILSFEAYGDPILRSTLNLDAADRQIIADVLDRTYDRDPAAIMGYIERISDAEPGVGIPMGISGEFSGGFADIIRDTGNPDLINEYALNELAAAGASADDSGRALSAATALAGLPPTGPGSLQEFLRAHPGEVSTMIDELGGRLGGEPMNAGFPNPFLGNPALGDLLERASQMTTSSGALAPEALQFFEDALPALGDNYASLQGAASFVLASGASIPDDVQRDFFEQFLSSPIAGLVESNSGQPIIELLVRDPDFAPMAGVPTADRQAVADSLIELVNDEKFTDLNPDARFAVISQALNYPSALAIDNLRHLSNADWFEKMSLDDQQRSAKMIGFVTQEALAATDADQRDLLLTSIGQFLPPDGTLELNWVHYNPPPGTIQFGAASNGVLDLNEDLIVGGNDPVDLTINHAEHLALSTMPHEVNHLMTGDTPAGTYERFIDEYRAFYVGFRAENGRDPTRQEAWDRIDDQLNLSLYSHLADAARGTDRTIADILTGAPGTPSQDSQDIVEFVGQFYASGTAPDPNAIGSGQDVINDTHTSGPDNPSGVAPLPDPIGNMDNAGEPG